MISSVLSPKSFSQVLRQKIWFFFTFCICYLPRFFHKVAFYLINSHSHTHTHTHTHTHIYIYICYSYNALVLYKMFYACTMFLMSCILQQDFPVDLMKVDVSLGYFQPYKSWVVYVTLDSASFMLRQAI